VPTEERWVLAFLPRSLAKLTELDEITIAEGYGFDFFIDLMIRKPNEAEAEGVGLQQPTGRGIE